MIKYLEGDIFSSPAQTIVNTVNTVGVMGKGIALEYKKRYPSMFEKYKSACEKKRLKIGNLMLCYEADHWILLFPTKENWRNPSRLEYIEQGLIKFTNSYAESGITSIAFPKLGCGNGDLSWGDVRPLMEKHLSDIPIDIYVYTKPLAESLPEHKDQSNIMKWLRQNARDLSFNGLCDDIRYNCSIVPYSFKKDGANVNVQWRDGIVFSLSESEEMQLSEDELFECWDEVRKKGVVSKGVNNRWDVVYSMLFALGYFSKVVVDNGTEKEEGYQLNQGLGRLYSLEGNANV